jgi:phenylalanyl-tRNA synthetase alpha chain
MEEKVLQLLIEALSPIERKVLPFLKKEEQDIWNIEEKSGADKTTILRALEFLKNKEFVKLKVEEEKIIDLDVNGILYLKRHLPERRLLIELEKKNSIPLFEIGKQCDLSEDETKIAIGVLKRKAMINISSERVFLTASKAETAKKMLEEQLLERLPLNLEKLKPEEKFALESLKNRRQIIKIEVKKNVSVSLTENGEKASKFDLDKGMIEELTPKMIQTESWKGKKFRRYDILSPVPRLYGGKRHFVNQSTEYAKKIWLELGFKEMEGEMVVSSFWNFDALFTAQDHPVREMQDTFFLKEEGKLPDKKLVEKIKEAHEQGVGGSKGWQYKWNEENAKKVVMRTHTTCISAQTLKKIAEKKEFPAKYFALGKCFRNETVDATHGFEFNQTEGIVVDENANFAQLLGYLKEFFKKMGYEKLRIRPSYFPYTEPSIEIDVFHPIFNRWLELGGAGMFRPEVTIPFFGKHVPVLAWGPGFDRIIMEFFKISDLREMYRNDINKLRETRFWRR